MALSTLWLQNVDYPARIDRAVFDNIWTEGILGAGSFAVTPSSPVGMSVNVAAGVGVIQGDDQIFQGKYLTREQAATNNVAIFAAPGSGTRHDLVVIQVRDPNATGPAGNDAVITIVQGTASVTPVDPALPASALPLARVRVPAGTGSITAGLIDDLRVLAKDAYNTTPTGSVGVAELTTAVAQALVPTGTITAFGGTVAPTGWLICDGTAYASASFPALSSVLGAQYNVSGGQSSPPAGQFRVPLLSGRVPVGRITGDTDFDTNGKTGGVKTVTLTAAQSGLVGHSHTVSVSGTTSANDANHSHTQQGSFASGPQDTNHSHAQQGSFGTTGQDVDHFHGGTTASNGSHSHSIELAGSSGTHSHQSASASNRAAGEPFTFSGSGTRTGIVNSAGAHTHVFNTAGTSNSHAHSVTLSGSTGNNSANHAHSVTISGNTSTQSANHAHTVTSTGTAAAVTAASATTAHDNVQPFIVVNYIIKT